MNLLRQLVMSAVDILTHAENDLQARTEEVGDLSAALDAVRSDADALRADLDGTTCALEEARRKPAEPAVTNGEKMLAKRCQELAVKLAESEAKRKLAQATAYMTPEEMAELRKGDWRGSAFVQAVKAVGARCESLGLGMRTVKAYRAAVLGVDITMSCESEADIK